MRKTLQMEIQDLLAVAPQALARLSAAFALSYDGTDGTIFYTRSRIKTEESITAKLMDRRSTNTRDYSLADIKDIIGLRLVVLYDQNLERALSLALKTLADFYHSSNGKIGRRRHWKEIHEVKFFPRNKSPNDPYIKMYTNLLKEHGEYRERIQVADITEKEYSSMHIQTNLKIQTGSGFQNISAEIQVRTAIEDVWSEISHNNRYKKDITTVWSERLQELTDQSDLDIKAIKAQLDASLPAQIARVSSRSKEIAREIERVRDCEYSEFESVLINYIHMISSDRWSRATREAMDEYSKTITKFRTILIKLKLDIRLEKLEVADALAACKNCEALTHKMAFEGLSPKLRFNTEYLIRFERMRLDSIGNELMRLMGDHNEAQLRSRQRENYSQIDALQIEDEIVVKPIALFEYWKHKTAEYTGQMDEHKWAHLEACLAAMNTDPLVSQSNHMFMEVPKIFAYREWLCAEGDKSLLADGLRSSSIEHAMRRRYQQAFALAHNSRAACRRMTRCDFDLLSDNAELSLLVCQNNLVFYATECLASKVDQPTFKDFNYDENAFRADVDDLYNRSDEIRHRSPQVLHTLVIAFLQVGDEARARDAKSLLLAQEAQRNLQDRHELRSRERIAADLAKLDLA